MSHSKKTNGFRKAKSLSFAFGFLVESFWISAKKYRHVWQNCILSLTGKNWGRRFEQFCQCLFFSDFRRQLFEIVAIYLGATLSELPCKCPEESFGKKMKKLFFFVFGWWAKNVWTFGKNNRQVCQNCFLFLHTNILGKKVTLFSFVWSLNGMFSKFWLVTWGKSVGTAL